MSTQFGRLFRRSGVGPLVNSFGESVVYMPKGGTERPVDAIIERDVELFEEGLAVRADIMRVRIDATEGILATEINTGGDQIRYALREGLTPVAKRIATVLSTDNGFVQFKMK